MATEWEMNHVHRIGDTIRRLRGDRSAQWLSSETTRLGMPISRSTLADIENRRRRYLTTSELCVIAAALGVSPVVLLFPDLPDGTVDLLPGFTVTSLAAADWFSGLPTDIPLTPPTDIRLVASSRARDHEAALVATAYKTLRDLLEASTTEGPLTPSARRALEVILEHQRAVEELNHALTELGGTVETEDGDD